MDKFLGYVMPRGDRVAIADEKTPGQCSVTIVDGAITTINVIDAPHYWYDNQWHPYPKSKLRHER